ncbi:hypothetical protein Dsin_008894 [Dipteronia sinensis]|uniref:SWIM-type domain-containing protein n=1 Tax=Dipteronia sinensis TaxID=43782 RepID=A0AAE0AQP9_9ROSI|nr:hypothetical protein Dsin_008894 [Dipteronia sinensis]
MSQIKAVDLAAYSWLLGIPSKHWSRHGFEESIKVDHVTNNITESFNNWVNPFRGMPVLSLLEQIRRKQMRRIKKRHDQCLQWATTLPPAIHKRLEDIKKEARHIIPIWAGEDEYEVKDISRHYIVKLISHHCECGLWQISALPCKHDVACVNTWRKDLNEYVHPYLKKEAYLRTYSFMIHPIPDESTWSEVEADNEVQPPVKKRLPGRPKLARRREADVVFACNVAIIKRSCSRNAENINKRTRYELDVGSSAHNLSAADFETFTGTLAPRHVDIHWDEIF